MNLKYLLLINILFLIKLSCNAQSALCDYKPNWFATCSLADFNKTYYSCELKTNFVDNLNRKLTKIYGQHLINREDEDVEFLYTENGAKITKIKSIFCNKFPNLEVLATKVSNINKIDENSLLSCENLETLWIDESKIVELPELLLIRSSKLVRFWFRNNKMTTLHDNFFLNQRILKILELQNNQINFLPSKIFQQLSKLEILHLYGNRLQEINPEWFKNLKNLKILSLDGNEISEIPEKSFEFMANLEELWLYGNSIQSLKHNSFEGLLNLKILGLNDNKIADLPADIFKSLKKLTEIDLNNNKLVTIHSDSFEFHENLKILDFSDNNLKSIDRKFSGNLTLEILNIDNNICSSLDICINNYEPRITQNNSCGKSKILTGNIIGGHHASRGDYPWMAALLKTNNDFFCGGTVISSRKVTTAAHCIHNKRTKEKLLSRDFNVALGTYDLEELFEVGRTIHAIKSIHIHDDWNIYTDSYDADIAVLVLEHEIIFNLFIQPICFLSSDSKLINATNGIVVGYGKSEVKFLPHETIPKVIETPIWNHRNCFEDDKDLAWLSSGRTFCGGSGKGVGVCKGDSGSGLFVTDGYNYYIRGIVSSSLKNVKNDCDVDTYAVYTDVMKFTNWINGI